MNVSIRKILWTAFGALFLLVVGGVALNLFVLQLEKQQQDRIDKVYAPLLERMMSMDRDIAAMLAAARGYTLTKRMDFVAQYDEAVRSF